nr:hypothetical protein [Tanacetum cinerariifolium]
MVDDGRWRHGMERASEIERDKIVGVPEWRLLASFLDDAKYEHVAQDTRSQGGKDLKEKDLKISEQKTKSIDNDKRLKIKDHTA